jgi:hypothetical protein
MGKSFANGADGASRSLQDIMNAMAQRVGGQVVTPGPARGVLSEAEAYAHADLVLAGLLKQYRDAQGRYETLLRRNGSADAMVAVAADIAEGCDGAVETRLIELRACPLARRMAEQRMRDSLEALNASARYRDKISANDAAYEENARRRREAARDSYLWVMVLMWMLQDTLRETQRRLSVAHDFMTVSARDSRHAATA